MPVTPNADPPMIVRQAQKNGFARVNSTFVEQLGYDKAELQRGALLEWIHPEDRAGLQRLLDAGDGSLQARHQTRAGDWLAFDWQVRSQEDGSVALGLLHDRHIIEDRSVGASTAGAPETLHANLEAMALIVEAERPGMKCSVLLLNEAGTHVTVGGGPSLPAEYNQAIEGLVIGPFVGSCGTASFWKQPVIVTDIQKDPLWSDLKEYAKTAGVRSCWSHPVTAHNGEVLGAAALYSPEPRAPTQDELNGLATLARMFGLAIERSYADEALKKSEAERVKREAELEDQLHQAAKMEALGVLAGGLAHDFNNVLASVLANAEFAMTTVASDSDTHEMLCDIRTATRTAADLCGQMLSFAGDMDISTQRIECNSLIRELGGLLNVAVSKKATLEYDLSAMPLYVEADRAQLGQVIMNLITNAAESLENAPGQIRAETGMRSYDAHELTRFEPPSPKIPGQYVWFSVSDTGSGMSAETRSKIFDPFFTTKFTGRGLGLAAVRGIIHRHGGCIGIESELGVGTTFTVLLPRAEAPEINAESLEQVDVYGHPQGKGVLIVDDDVLLMKGVARGLRAVGFTVFQAKSGREAIDVFQREGKAIDCVLLDLSMPELDGEETFRELKNIRADVRVVITSGYAKQQVIERFEGADIAGVLRKPTPMSVLVDKLLDAIR